MVWVILKTCSDLSDCFSSIYVCELSVQLILCLVSFHVGLPCNPELHVRHVFLYRRRQAGGSRDDLIRVLASVRPLFDAIYI